MVSRSGDSHEVDYPLSTLLRILCAEGGACRSCLSCTRAPQAPGCLRRTRAPHAAQPSLTSARRVVPQIKQEDVVLRADDDREAHGRHGCLHAAQGSDFVGQLRLVVPGL